MSRILQRTFYINKPLASTTSVVNGRLGRSLCSSSDDEKKPKAVPEHNKPKKGEAINKLNDLLQQIVKDDQENKHTLNLAKPRGRNAKTEPGVKSAKVETVQEKLVTAVKDVANTLGGNKSQTESELINRLINNDEKIPNMNLSDLVRGMKIDKKAKPETVRSKAQQVRSILENSASSGAPSQRHPRMQKAFKKPIIATANVEPINIFGAEPLGIFNKDTTFNENKMNVTWDKLYERELKLAVTHPPMNYFQEQILWTEQGKTWKFPIDNEQGMEKEQSVYFAEHVFLEEHLSPWCPEKGPLRHFMELVCVGLSKNPHMSVQDKREHIKWFENYFEEKKKLLKETGAIPAEVKIEANKPIEGSQ